MQKEDVMTMNRLDEIAARAEAATPGPWGVRHDYGDNTSTVHAGMSSLTRCVDCGVEAEYDKPDAEFIAHAREDVPALVKALRAVESVHRKSYAPHPRGLDEPSVFICLECLDQWPCPTIRAIEGALG